MKRDANRLTRRELTVILQTATFVSAVLLGGVGKAPNQEDRT